MIYSEFKKFLYFFITLIFIVAILTTIRTENSIYLYAGSGLLSEDAINKKTNLLQKFKENIISLATLNFGNTLSGQKVSFHIIERLEPTFFLSFLSIVASGFLSVTLCLIAVYIQKETFGKIISLISNLILSTPIFIVSVLLFIVFFLELSWLPPGGYNRWEISYLILPSIALGSRTFSRIFLIAYNQASEELKSQYILLLKARGFSLKIIVFKYIFWKIIPLILVYLLLDFSSLLSGAMIVEEIFFYPGIGKSTYTAIKNMDENLLKGLLVYSGIIFYSLTRLARILQNKMILNSESNG